jgi:hypothetical protein
MENWKYFESETNSDISQKEFQSDKHTLKISVSNLYLLTNSHRVILFFTINKFNEICLYQGMKWKKKISCLFA